MQPVRHILGALLFEQGHVEEAEEVYRADIKLWKDNMWGLLGLNYVLKQEVTLQKNLPKLPSCSTSDPREQILFQQKPVSALKTH